MRLHVRPLVALLLGAPLLAGGGTVWDGGGGNNRWNTANNWNPNGVPTFNSSTDLTFTGATRLNPDTNGNRTINSILFDAGAGAFVITGDNGPNTETLTFAGTDAGVTQLSASDQTFTVNRIQWSANATLDVAGAGDLVFGNGSASAANFHGTGALTKTGTGGALVLNANNSNWSGGLTISAGVVEARTSGSALGTGNVDIGNSSTLKVTTGGLTFANNVTTAGTLSATGAGTTTFTGNVTGAGGITLRAGASATLELAGNLSGTTNVNKKGAGTVLLSSGSGNSFTGNLSVTDGTLAAGADGVFGSADVLLVAAGALVDLGDTAQTVNTLSGEGAIDFGATGELSLADGVSLFSGTFAGSGTLVIGAGATLQLGVDFVATGLSIRLAGGTLNLNGHSASFAALDVSAPSLVDFGGTSSLTFDTIGFSDGAAVLTVLNWTESDTFATANFPGVTPDEAASGGVAQVAFDGFPADHSAWSSYDQHVRPIPEMPWHGAAMVGSGLVWWWRRKRRRATA